MNNNILLVLSAGATALLFSFWKTKWIHSQEEGTQKNEDNREEHC